MSGFLTAFNQLPQVQQQQDQSALEDQGQQSRAKLGQSLQNQQGQLSQAQDDLSSPIQQQIQRESQDLQNLQPTSNRGGPIKRLLYNFLGAAGGVLERDFGIPTQQQKTQHHIQNLVALSNAQSLESERQANEAYRQQAMAGLQQQQAPMTPQMASQFGHPEWAGLTTQQALALAARVQPAEIGAAGKLGAANITGQFGVQKAQLGAENKTPTEIALQVKADQGDEQAKRILDRMQQEKMQQAQARGQAYGSFRPVNVIDPNTGQLGIQFAGQAIQQGMVPAQQGVPTMSKQAQFQEMHNASSQFRSAIQGLDREFTPDQIAKLQLASRAPDEGVLRTISDSLLGDQRLTPAQQDYVIWHNQMMERILSLRNVAGMGQGAADLRGAIQTTIPGPGAGSKQYSLKKLDAVDNQINLLERGIPKLGGGGNQDFGVASGFPEGHTGNTKSGIPVVVRGGRWVKR